MQIADGSAFAGGFFHSQPAADADDRLTAIMAKRRGQVMFRLAMMSLMMVFFWRYWSIPAMAGCAAAYVALQVWEAFVLPKTPRRLGGANLFRVLSIATIAASSIIFGFPAVMWTVHGGLLGLTCGAYLLSGSVLNTVFTTRDCKPAFLASIAPFLVYVVIGAVLASGTRFQLDIFLTVTIAGAMMAMSAVTLWRDASRTQRSEATAIEVLGQREVELERALERAEEASRSKSAFLANMSHELRTPLNGVLGMASVLSRSELSMAQRDMVEVIHGSARNLQALLSDVLDLAKIEALAVQVVSEPVVPAELARRLEGLFGAASREKGLTFGLEMDEGASAAVLSDGARISQILVNLCSNAVKFTERGGVVLSVSSTPEGSRRRVAFTVRDTGIGVASDVLPRLFQRFAQADGSITRRFGGTGLGLAISKQLCELLGGRIEVESVEGRGSAFTAIFELETIATFAVHAREDSDAPALFTRRPRVLLVEDHPVNRRVVQAMLAELADLTLTVNGEEGFEAARRETYDIILMDIQMPVMDGMSATRAIRAHERETGAEPAVIVMLTANALPEHVTLSLEAGADDHLAKPITSEALLNKIAAAMTSAEPVEMRLAS